MTKPQNYSTSSFINECFRGFGNYAYHPYALEKLSETNRELFLTTYQESLGLPKVNLSARVVTYVSEYQKARTAAFAALPAGTAFEQDPKRFQALSASFNTLDLATQKIGARFHPSDLTQYIEEERQKAVGTVIRGTPPNQTHTKGAILQQYEEDVELIEKNVDDPIKKKNALATLKAAHDAQLKALEEGLKKDTDALHKAVERERLRVSTFAVLRHENEQMKKHFDRAYTKTGGENMSLTMGGEGGVFQDLDFEKMVAYVGGNFKTLTGRDLNVTQTGNNPKTYQFSLDLPPPSRLWAAFTDIGNLDITFSNFRASWGNYYSDPSNSSMQDMLTAATLLKLSGEEKPCAKITGFTNSPELAMQQAQNAFAALRMAGYDEDAIKISINGKTYTLKGDKENNFDALFRTNPSRRQEIIAQVNLHQKEYKHEAFKATKARMDAERKKYENPAAPAAPSSAAPAAPATASSAAAAASPTDDATGSNSPNPEDENPSSAPSGGKTAS